MVYGGGDIDGDDNGVRGSGVGNSKQCGERVDPVLDSLSDLYSELDTISISTSGPSSYLTSHHLLTTPFKRTTNNFGLRIPFYSKQDLRDFCCFPI